MGEDGTYNIEADWSNLFPDIHIHTNKSTGIKISNTEDVSDFTKVFLFIVDKGYTDAHWWYNIVLFLKEIENGTVNDVWTVTASL